MFRIGCKVAYSDRFIRNFGLYAFVLGMDVARGEVKGFAGRNHALVSWDCGQIGEIHLANIRVMRN
jgi:hypothetical protein